MKKKLQQHLNLVKQLIPESDPRYKEMKAFMKELDKHPEKEWDKSEVLKKAEEASILVLDHS